MYTQSILKMPYPESLVLVFKFNELWPQTNRESVHLSMAREPYCHLVFARTLKQNMSVELEQYTKPRNESYCTCACVHSPNECMKTYTSTAKGAQVLMGTCTCMWNV